MFAIDNAHYADMGTGGVAVFWRREDTDKWGGPHPSHYRTGLHFEVLDHRHETNKNKEVQLQSKNCVSIPTACSARLIPSGGLLRHVLQRTLFRAAQRPASEPGRALATSLRLLPLRSQLSGHGQAQHLRQSPIAAACAARSPREPTAAPSARSAARPTPIARAHASPEAPPPI